MYTGSVDSKQCEGGNGGSVYTQATRAGLLATAENRGAELISQYRHIVKGNFLFLL